MKKVVVAAIAVFAFGFTNAQGVKFGAKAGLNLANLNTNYSGVTGIDDNKMKVGFHVGGFAEIMFTEKLGIQPELVYSLQGATADIVGYDTNDNAVNVDNKINLSYINVPIMVKYYVIKGLFAEAGPQVGFLVSAKEKYSKSIQDDDDFPSNYNPVTDTFSTVDDKDVKDYYKSIDFGFNIGAGYEFTENLYANIRYNIGLSDISDTPDDTFVDLDGDGFDDDLDIFGGLFNDSFSTKNNVLSFSVGYKF